MPFEQTLSEGEAANQRRPMRAANGLERPRGIRSASRFPDPEGPMKRPARKTQKPQSQKRSASKRGAKAPAVRFGGAELDFIREILTSGVWEEDEERDSLEDMIDELLTAEPGDERGDLPELLEDIADALQDARLDADGGHTEARETLRNVRAMIDRAADRDTINPRVLLFLGRLFAKAEIDAGEAARAAMARLAASGFLRSPAESFDALVEPLFYEEAIDPFVLHNETRALTCIFPADYKAAFVERLATDANELARQAAVGFLLDRDDSVALAAVRGLAGASGRGQLDERLRRRIGTVRAWLQPVRQSAIDDAVGGARPMAPRAAANVA